MEPEEPAAATAGQAPAAAAAEEGQPPPPVAWKPKEVRGLDGLRPLEAQEFHDGQRVELTGLQGAPERNGTFGLS